MKKVTMYRTQVCPYCQMAVNLLKLKGVDEIEKIFIDKDESLRQQMESKTGRRTVPQIFIGDYHVGGYDDLVALDKQGKLVEILNED